MISHSDSFLLLFEIADSPLEHYQDSQCSPSYSNLNTSLNIHQQACPELNDSITDQSPVRSEERNVDPSSIVSSLVLSHRKSLEDFKIRKPSIFILESSIDTSLPNTSESIPTEAVALAEETQSSLHPSEEDNELYPKTTKRKRKQKPNSSTTSMKTKQFSRRPTKRARARWNFFYKLNLILPFPLLYGHHRFFILPIVLYTRPYTSYIMASREEENTFSLKIFQ